MGVRYDEKQDFGVKTTKSFITSSDEWINKMKRVKKKKNVDRQNQFSSHGRKNKKFG